MPGQPSRSQVHVDRPLSMLTVAYLQNEAEYIAPRAAPIVRVAKQSDKYFEFDKEFMLRTEADVRGPGAESAGSGYKVSNKSYFADVYALHTDVDDQTRRNADEGIDLDREGARFVAGQLALKREQVLASAIFGASAWGSSGAPATLWDDVASTPIEDVRAQYNVIRERTGRRPNAFIAGAEVFKRLVDHPDVLDRIKHAAGPGNPAIANEQALAAVFGVERFLVLWASNNTAAEGAAGSYDFLGNSGKNALLAYIAPSPGLMQPSALYTFAWQPLSLEVAISRFRIERNKSDRIEAEMAFDIKVTGADLGHEFTSAVAS